MGICSSEREFVDFNPAGVTKGNGLRRLAAMKGWRMENILARCYSFLSFANFS